MRHWLFLSYARKNLEAGGRRGRLFLRFVNDLETALGQHGAWEADAIERPMFFDRRSLQLMTDWRTELLRALQTSRVFACLVSPAYTISEFCAKEFWVFDERRRAISGPRPPAAVVLPIVWIPAGPLPAALANAQFDHAELPAAYRESGLLSLMMGNRWVAYEQCVDVFAREILRAGHEHPFIPEKEDVPDFEDVPLAFEPGTARARFAYLAAARSAFEGAPWQDRYSDRGADWRPFDPPVARTVKEISSTIAAEQNMAYSELAADATFADNLRRARPRDRVVLVVDPWTLCRAQPRPPLPPPDALASGRLSIVAPFGDASHVADVERQELERALDAAFPNSDVTSLPFERTESLASFRAAVARSLAASHLTAIATAAETKPQSGALPTLSTQPAGANG
jgi:FxsC-like protein